MVDWAARPNPDSELAVYAWQALANFLTTKTARPISATKSTAKRLPAQAMIAVLGRRNTVRLARNVLDRARLDVPNDIEGNGELLVQRRVLARCGGAGSAIVFDVGAHFGEWSWHLLKQSRSLGASVALHLFEPSLYSFSRLTESLDLPSGCLATANREAMSDGTGSAVLYKAHEGAGSSSLHGGQFTRELTESVSVNTIDNYCRLRELGRIDLLKCDAEGNDMSVMRGARTQLEEHRVSVLQFEYNHRWIYARDYLRDAFDLLLPRGYRIGKITPRGIELYEQWEPDLETFKEANYVALNGQAVGWFPTVSWWK